MDSARTTLSEGDWPVLDHLEKSLGGQPGANVRWAVSARSSSIACVRFQQLTSPAAARSRGRHRASIAQRCCCRVMMWASVPQQLQRTVDRIRIDQPTALGSLSGQPAGHRHPRPQTRRRHPRSTGSAQRVRRLVRGNRSSSGAPWQHPLRSDADTPSAGDELILYQVLLGSWPLDQGDDFDGYQQRLWQWQQKALREAKLNSSWSAPNDAYEQGVEAFLSRRSLSEEGRTLRTAIAAAAQAIAPAGALNAAGAILASHDCAGCTRPVPGRGVLGLQPGGPGQPSSGGFQRTTTGTGDPQRTSANCCSTGVTGASNRR